jgi:hypothetical protein
VKIVIYCKHQTAQEGSRINQKTVKVVRGCASVHVPRTGDYVQIDETVAGPVDMVQWKFGEGMDHTAYVRLPPDYFNDFKEVGE